MKKEHICMKDTLRISTNPLPDRAALPCKNGEGIILPLRDKMPSNVIYSTNLTYSSDTFI